MKKYIIGGVVALLMLGSLMIFWRTNENKEVAKYQEEVTPMIQDYYKNMKIDNKENSSYFKEPKVYEEQYKSKYILLDNEAASTPFMTAAKEYYEYLDQQITPVVEVKDVVVRGHEARALLTLEQSVCYQPEISNDLFKKYSDLSTADTVNQFFVELKTKTEQCLKADKKTKESVTRTLKKEKNQWLIYDFSSILDDEVASSKTKLKQGAIANYKAFAQVYENTTLRFIDFNISTKNKKMTFNDNNQTTFDFAKKEEMTIEIEVLGKKDDTFEALVYDENRNELTKEKFKLTKTHQVFAFEVTPTKELQMLQLYLVSSKQANVNDQPLDQRAFGRIYVIKK